MTLLTVTKEPEGWTVRVGARAAGLFRSRLHAVDQAHWLRDQLRSCGVETEVRSPTPVGA